MLVKVNAPYLNLSTFTHGKEYEAWHHKNALWAVRDNLGHVRYIIPGHRCPHLKMTETYMGRFEKIGEDE